MKTFPSLRICQVKMMYNNADTDSLPPASTCMPAEPLNGMPRMSEQTAKVKTLRVEREKPTDKQTSGAIRAHTQKRAFEWKTPRLLCKSDRRSVEWKLRMHQGNAYVVRWLNRMFTCAKVIHSYVHTLLCQSSSTPPLPRPSHLEPSFAPIHSVPLSLLFTVFCRSPGWSEHAIWFDFQHLVIHWIMFTHP